MATFIGMQPRDPRDLRFLITDSRRLVFQMERRWPDFFFILVGSLGVSECSLVDLLYLKMRMIASKFN
jgi:hypothetical protein